MCYTNQEPKCPTPEEMPLREEKTDTSEKKGNEAFQALFYEKASVDTNMNASE